MHLIQAWYFTEAMKAIASIPPGQFSSCPWNAPQETYIFLIGCPLPRRKCLGALDFSKTEAYHMPAHSTANACALSIYQVQGSPCKLYIYLLHFPLYIMAKFSLNSNMPTEVVLVRFSTTSKTTNCIDIFIDIFLREALTSNANTAVFNMC